MKKKVLKLTTRKSLVGASFILPWIIGFFWFFFVPLVQSLMLSVGENIDVLSFKIKFIGMDNYSRAFFSDANFVPMFIGIVKETLTNVPLITVFSFYIAILLNRKIKGRAIFRAIYFLPVILGTGFIMRQLLSQNIEQSSIEAAKAFLLPDEIVRYLGADITTAIVTFLSKLTFILWRSGVQILIFLSGLQSINSTLYEAAKVDSATEWESLWFITIPMMMPTILLNIVYTMVDGFTDATNPIIEYIGNMAFSWANDYSYASAMGWIYLIFTLILIAVVFIPMRKISGHEKI